MPRGALIVLVLAIVAASTAASPAQRFTVQDSIRMAYFDSKTSLPDSAGDDGIFSADGQYYARLTHRGLLPSGETEATIWVFDVVDVRRRINDPQRSSAGSAIALTRMSSTASCGNWTDRYAGNVIKQLRWSRDSRRLSFRACSIGDKHQLYTVRLKDHQVKQLTPDKQDVLDYDWEGDTFVYLAKSALQEGQMWGSTGYGIQDIQVGTGFSLIELLYPNWSAALGMVATEVWQIRDGVHAQVVDPETDAPVLISGSGLGGMVRTVSVSPDGSRAIVTANVTRIPQLWENYEQHPRFRPIVADEGEEAFHADDIPRDISRLQQYVLIDLDSGSSRPLIHSPIAGSDRGWPRVRFAPLGRLIQRRWRCRRATCL